MASEDDRELGRVSAAYTYKGGIICRTEYPAGNVEFQVVGFKEAGVFDSMAQAQAWLDRQLDAATAAMMAELLETPAEPLDDRIPF